jgi:hypothetical protein
MREIGLKNPVSLPDTLYVRRKKMNRFAYPNVNAHREFIGCGRFAVFSDDEHPAAGYEVADPNIPRVRDISDSVVILAPGSSDLRQMVYEERDQAQHYVGGSLGLAYLLANIKRFRKIRLNYKGDIWCTGCVRLYDKPILTGVDNFDVKLEAFLSAENEDSLFIVPESNLRENGLSVEKKDVRILSLNAFRKAREKFVGKKTIIELRREELPLLTDTFFETQESDEADIPLKAPADVQLGKTRPVRNLFRWAFAALMLFFTVMTPLKAYTPEITSQPSSRGISQKMASQYLEDAVSPEMFFSKYVRGEKSAEGKSYILTLIGNEFLEKGELADAIKLFEAALRLHPENKIAFDFLQKCRNAINLLNENGRGGDARNTYGDDFIRSSFSIDARISGENCVPGLGVDNYCGLNNYPEDIFYGDEGLSDPFRNPCFSFSDHWQNSFDARKEPDMSVSHPNPMTLWFAGNRSVLADGKTINPNGIYLKWGIVKHPYEAGNYSGSVDGKMINPDISFEAGIFTGEVKFDRLYYGGSYQDKLELAGMDNFTIEPESMRDAVTRVFSGGKDWTERVRFAGSFGESRSWDLNINGGIFYNENRFANVPAKYGALHDSISRYKNDGVRVSPDIAARPPSKRLFAVGINDYKFTRDEWKSLKFAVSDAENVSEAFRAYGFETELLTDRNAVKSDIIRQLYDEVSQSRPGDTFVLYFAGHGFSDIDGDMFILPYLDENRGPDARVISLDEIKALLSLHKGKTYLIVDNCFNQLNIDLDGGDISEMGTFESKFIRDNGDAGFPVCLLGSSPGERAFESETYDSGLATHAMLEYLADTEPETSLNFSAMFEYVRAETPRLALSLYRLPQHPVIMD